MSTVRGAGDQTSDANVIQGLVIRAVEVRGHQGDCLIGDITQVFAKAISEKSVSFTNVNLRTALANNGVYKIMRGARE